MTSLLDGTTNKRQSTNWISSFNMTFFKGEVLKTAVACLSHIEKNFSGILYGHYKASKHAHALNKD